MLLLAQFKWDHDAVAIENNEIIEVIGRSYKLLSRLTVLVKPVIMGKRAAQNKK